MAFLTSCRAARKVVALGFGLTLCQQAVAQSTISPPRQDSSSSTGVSYRNGTFSYSEEDLSIGDKATGLSLSRIYNSGVVRSGPAVNWNYSIDGYVSVEALPVHPDYDQPPEGQEPYIYNVVLGGTTVGFVGGSGGVIRYNNTGGPVGTYQPALPSGAQLIYTGTATTGYYTFTDSDGTVANFTAGSSRLISNVMQPDGTRLDYTYNGEGIRSIFSNRGWAILFEGTAKVCAVNTARTYVTPTSSCPSGAQTVIYVTTPGTYTAAPLLTSVTKAGATASLSYNSKDHLSCIRALGQSICKLQNTYTECAEDPQVFTKQYSLHLHDYVSGQQDAGGKSYAYTYNNQANYPVNCPQWRQEEAKDYRPFNGSFATMTENQTIVRWFSLDRSGLPIGIEDPLNRATMIELRPSDGPAASYLPDARVSGITQHEGNKEAYSIDARGNVTAKTITSKAGSETITMLATFPSTCVEIKTCNKPSSVTDGRGNVTDYTYDPAHGGMLTETGPAVGGVQPRKRFAYVQRYAWLSTGSGHAQAATPIWLLNEERTCRTTATNGNACAGGAADEVVTSYDYGPDSGPNNLLLRGVAVTADGQTLRTCYGYDAQGNRIWESRPRAGLAACS